MINTFSLERRSHITVVLMVLQLNFLLILVELPIVLGSSSSLFDSKASQNYMFVQETGSRGTGDGQFVGPHDLEFDKDDIYLYAVDLER